MSRADPGKNSEPSESKMSLELRPTAPSDLGRSNEAFQVSRAKGDQITRCCERSKESS
jgi:hypothetical protein